MSAGDELTDIENTFAEVALALFAPGTVEGTLQKIVQFAVLAIDGCEAAGVLAAGDDGRARSMAASSAVAVMLGQMQIEAGGGPCVASAHNGSTIYVDDLIDDARWPEFTSSAVDAGIRTVLAHALPTAVPSALNLYASLPDTFDADARAQALLFATLARLALDVARERAVDEERTVNFSEGLRTRELIGQAQGILIEREHLTGGQAFEVLRQASQHLNIKLREVAALLVETGERPDTGTAGTPRTG